MIELTHRITTENGEKTKDYFVIRKSSAIIIIDTEEVPDLIKKLQEKIEKVSTD